MSTLPEVNSVHLSEGRRIADPLSAECRLLILDDEPMVGETILAMTKSIGAAAQYTESAETFLQLLESWQPTHIALDLMMPEADGVSMIQQLGKIGTNAKLLIVSGADARIVDAAQRSARQHGLSLVGALAKPFTRNALATLLSVSTAKPKPPPDTSTRVINVSASDLKQALETRAIGPVFQPKVCCTDGRLVGFEALARWWDNGKLVCGPDVFIPLAEGSGQVDALTVSMIEQSMQWLAANFADADYTMAINVPADCLRRPGLIDMLERACVRLRVNPRRVVIEITESGAIGEHVNVLDTVTKLRLMGVHLSIDDFGVGFSSLVQLARLPFSEVKIDRSFVAGLCYSSESQAIVSAVIGMAEGLGMTTVAEGVEDLDTYLRLRELGCNVAQGYFIARPMTGPKVVEWLGTAISTSAQ